MYKHDVTLTLYYKLNSFFTQIVIYRVIALATSRISTYSLTHNMLELDNLPQLLAKKN